MSSKRKKWRPRPGERMSLDLPLALHAAIELRQQRRRAVSKAAVVRTILTEVLQVELHEIAQSLRMDKPH